MLLYKHLNLIRHSNGDVDFNDAGGNNDDDDDRNDDEGSRQHSHIGARRLYSWLFRIVNTK